MNRPPLKVNQSFFDLTAQANVQAASINFNAVSLPSERCVVVTETGSDGAGQLVTVDLKTQEVGRRPNKADAVMPHPKKNWMVVRAKSAENDEHTTVIVYNMDSKEKVLTCNVPDQIKFWTWVDDKTVGMVGGKSVFHLSLEGVSGTENRVQAEKLFDREGAFAPGNAIQVINYDYLASKKFAFLCGLSKKPDGPGFTIGGNTQLTSTALGKSQAFEGFTACFGRAKVGDDLTESELFAFVEKNKLAGTLTISELGAGAGPKKFKQVVEMTYPEGSEADFPISMSIEPTLGLLFLFTKMGLLFVFEISEGALLLRSKVSEAQLILGCPYVNARGCLVLSKSGKIISIIADEQPLADFVRNAGHIKNNQVIAKKLALRAGLPGSEGYYIENFNSLFLQGDYDAAAKIVAKSPDTILRNIETINRYRGLPKPESGPHPILKYFLTLLESGLLNQVETRELCQLVIQQNKPQMISKWIDESKLALTEEIGDMVVGSDSNLAERIYTLVGSPKVMQLKLRKGGKELDSIIATARPDDLLSQLKTMCISDPQGALGFAKSLARSGKIAPQNIAELFLNNSMQNELTSFCLECLPDTVENGNWQTLVLELNLKKNPGVVETIFQTGKWSHYDKKKIAGFCEAANLPLRALENYTDLKDIKRILVNNALNIPPEYLKNFVSNTLPPEHIPAVLLDIVKNSRNVKLAVEISQNVYRKVGVKELVDVFEQANSWEGIFLLLQPLLQHTKDQKVYHKFLEACIKIGQLQEAEKVIQNYVGYYDPPKVLEMFQSVKLADPKALIILCDKNNYIKDMIKYLWENSLNVYIEMYVIRVNPSNAGEVLGALMDLGAEESYIKQLLNTIGANCNVETVVKEFEAKNKLRLLENWLEQRSIEGNTLKEVHNALAKLAIDFDKNPEAFLHDNRHYDVKLIGAYAENRDPHLAFIAYKRDPGQCDEEIIELTNKSNLYRLQAKFLVERMSKELWEKALSPQNPHRSAVVEQVVSSALPESKSVEEVSATVQAFMVADMPEELLGLLEKIVLHSNEFSSIKKLQNLLIFTAMKTDKSRVMDYLTHLDNYEGSEITKVALDPKYKLYEEAFFVFNKIKQPVDAVDVLINKIGNIERATEYAEKANQPEVWCVLAKAYLERGSFEDAVNAFIKAKDTSSSEDLIILNRKNPHYEKLLEYFDMARQIRKEAIIDNEYIYCLAKLNKLPAIENFVNGPNSADLARTGDRLYNEKLWEAAKILYIKMKSNAKIASCLVRLSQYPAAIEYAKKANNVKTWKEIVFACVEVKEYKLAAVAGTQVVLIPDHLEEMVQFYELNNAPEEMINVLEQTVTNEKSHIGIFTELAALYAKYNEAKLFDFIKAYFQKLNVTKLIRVCKKYQHWKEIVYLHSNYKEYDNAVKTMIEHSPSCFSHDNFVMNLLKVSNSDLIYNAIQFYIEEEPMKLNELLKQITSKVDISKVVAVIKRTGNIALIVDWLKSAQNQNNQAVNDALNSLYLEIEDYEALRNSIQNYDSIDAIGLAKQIEGSDHPEFRRISALIYRKNKKYRESIEISVTDSHFRDAIETAQESKQTELIEKLIQYFCDNNMKEYFTVATYTCYELLEPDYIMEMSWRYGLNDYAMPFNIQVMRDMTHRVDHVKKRQEANEKKEEEKLKRDEKMPLGGMMGPTGFNPLINPGVPMLMGGPTQSNFGALSQGVGGFGMGNSF